MYLVALPFALDTSPTNYVGKTLGMAVYKSADGGRTWGLPQVIHRVDFRDDKQWAVGDTSPNSPFRGNVYAAWDYGGGLTNLELDFARTTNHGISRYPRLVSVAGRRAIGGYSPSSAPPSDSPSNQGNCGG